MIRPARPADLPWLPELQVTAGALFRDVGMAEVAEGPAPTVDELGEYQRRGNAWVGVGEGERPIAFILVEIVDGRAHIEQVSVRRDHAGRGIGARLIQAVDEWAASRALRGLSLTTFVDVPWNGPYYARLGFRYLPEDQLTAGLRAIRRHEADLGLDRWLRAAMVRDR